MFRIMNYGLKKVHKIKSILLEIFMSEMLKYQNFLAYIVLYMQYVAVY